MVPLDLIRWYQLTLIVKIYNTAKTLKKDLKEVQYFIAISIASLVSCPDFWLWVRLDQKVRAEGVVSVPCTFEDIHNRMFPFKRTHHRLIC